jgi:hypothetical protein
MADMLGKSIQIAEGKENVTLPEEAMHFLVALIKVNRPNLYDSLISQVRDYKLYKTLIGSPVYTESELYRKDNGSLNLTKIKEEAVAKVLAEYLIDALEGQTEKPELMLRARNWWKEIVDWIKTLFGKYTDPFEQVIEDLSLDNFAAYGDVEDLNIDPEIYLSTTNLDINERDQKYTENKALFENIKSRPHNLKITKIDDKYYIDGKEGKRRVSDLVEDYYADLFRNKIIPDELKPFYEQTRKDGTLIHEIFQEVLQRVIDPETGLLRDRAIAMSPAIVTNPIAVFAYEYLAKNIIERVGTYPEGTRFLIEQIIYDPNREMFGTVDFIGIKPDNTVDIIDWKTIYYEEFSKITGIKEYKEEAFNIQIKSYKRMLQDYYGVDKFGQLRAIPIKKQYINEKDNNGIPTGRKLLRTIQIGSANPKEIKDEALKPVIIKEETTGNEKLDKFINILDKIAEDIKSKKRSNKFDAGLYDLMKKSIYELRVAQDVDNLYKYSAIELANIKSILEDVKKNKENYTNEDIDNVLAQLNYYDDLLGALEKSNLLVREDFLIDEVSGKLNKLVNAYEKARQQISDLRKELTNKVAKNYGIFNLLKPEKVMGFWTRYMRTMSQAQTSAIQLLYKMASKVFNRVDLEDSNQRREIEEKRKGVEDWAKRNNITMKEAIKHLLKFDKNGNWTGNMISTLDSKFYEDRSSIINSNDKKAILEWWDKNYDLDAYANWYDSEYTKYKQEVEDTTYSQDADINRDTRAYLLDRFEKRYNIAKHTMTALGPHNKQIWSKNIRETKWYSQGYSFLLKSENKELLEAYNHFNKINKELAEAGIIEAWREHTFVPSVRRGFAETFSFQDSGLFSKVGAGTKAWAKGIKDSMAVKDNEVNYLGYINPITGEREDKLFAAYTAEIGEWVKDKEGNTRLSYSNKSADLFKVFDLMNRQKLRYKYLSSIEDIAQALKHVEATKGSIAVNKFGSVQKDKQGHLQVIDDNTKNLDMLEKHIRAIIFGQVIQSESDTYIQVSRNGFKRAWNKSPFGKITQLKENPNEKPTKISGIKAIMKLNNFNQIRILGLNLSSATANLFGGTASTFLINKEFFTDKDLSEAATQIVSGQWYATDDMKKRAALADYLLPILDQRKNYHASQLSVSKSVRILSQDWLMAPQRKTDDIVQLNIFLATIANTTVIDGELVNIRKHIQTKYGYSGRFNLPESERKALETKVEKEIEETKKNSNLVKIAKFEKVKQTGKDVTIVTIPGINRNSETVEQFRETIQNISKRVLGNTSEFDLAAYKYNVWARLFMTFKNWIPRTLDVRFGEFRYDVGHDAWEWGRARMFYRAFATHWMKSFVKMVPILGRGVAKWEDKTYLIDKAKALYDEKVKMFKELGLYNEESFIKQDEFIQSFVQGVDAEFTEFRSITLLLLLFMSALFRPADGDDDETKNVKKKILRQVDKLSDELSFFYSPQSFIDVMGSKPLPVIGLASDMYKLTQQAGKQFFGFTFNNEKWEDQAKPLKYLFKIAPVTKELLGYIPIIDPEFAKEMGVQLQTQNRN